jgi:hypothetical protein
VHSSMPRNAIGSSQILCEPFQFSVDHQFIGNMLITRTALHM